jgi:hypothetical protein
MGTGERPSKLSMALHQTHAQGMVLMIPHSSTSPVKLEDTPLLDRSSGKWMRIHTVGLRRKRPAR